MPNLASRLVQAAYAARLGVRPLRNMDKHQTDRPVVVAVLRTLIEHIEAHSDSLPDMTGHWRQVGRIDGLAEAAELIAEALIDIEQEGQRDD